MIMPPFFTKNDDWYKTTNDGFILTEVGNKIPDVVKSFELFSKVSDNIVVEVDEEGNVIDNSAERNLQRYGDFEDYLDKKYENKDLKSLQ